MLSPAETALLAAFKRALVADLGDRLIALTLFGSRARGEGRDDSDLDVLVEIRGVTRADRARIIDLASDLSVESGLLLSPVVLLTAAPRLRAEVQRDGVVL